MSIDYGDKTENSPGRIPRREQPERRRSAHDFQSDGTGAPEDPSQEEGHEEADVSAEKNNRPYPSQDYGPPKETGAHGQGFGSRQTAHGEIAPDAKTLEFWLRYAAR